MDDAFITRLEQSFAAVAPQGQQLVKAFYDVLFERYPDVRALFPDDMIAQEGKLLSALALVVGSLRSFDTLAPMLQDLGKRHLDYGTQPTHYVAVRDCLVDTLAGLAADIWTDQLAADWRAALDLVAKTMIEGSQQDAQPPA